MFYTIHCFSFLVLWNILTMAHVFTHSTVMFYGYCFCVMFLYGISLRYYGENTKQKATCSSVTFQVQCVNNNLYWQFFVLKYRLVFFLYRIRCNNCWNDIKLLHVDNPVLLCCLSKITYIELCKIEKFWNSFFYNVIFTFSSVTFYV